MVRIHNGQMLVREAIICSSFVNVNKFVSSLDFYATFNNPQMFGMNFFKK